MSNVITNSEVSDWLDTFDGNDAELLLTAIANNEIKIEVILYWVIRDYFDAISILHQLD